MNTKDTGWVRGKRVYHYLGSDGKLACQRVLERHRTVPLETRPAGARICKTCNQKIGK